MATPAPVRPARKPRAKRDIVDTVEVLFAKVLEVANHFEKESDKARARKWGQSIVDLTSGDTQPNRRAMVALLKEVRQHLAYEADQAEKKAQALAEYETAVAPVRAEWSKALAAWTKFVQTENDFGHDGQLAIANALWPDFARMSPLVVTPKSSSEAVASLVLELEGLTFRAGNFVHTKWCVCGAPLYEITPRGEGKKPFMPKLCGECFRKPVVVAETTSSGSKKSRKPVLEFRAEPPSAEEIEANKKAARERNEANRLAKKAQKRANAEASAGKSQRHEEGALKSIRKHEKEERAQGGHPGAKGKKKGGKKKGASKGE